MESLIRIIEWFRDGKNIWLLYQLNVHKDDSSVWHVSVDAADPTEGVEGSWSESDVSLSSAANRVLERLGTYTPIEPDPPDTSTFPERP